MAFIKKLFKKLKKKGGLATVEMAIVVLLLLTITFGTIEYGWVFFRMQQVSNVAREAARTAALADHTTADVQNRIDTLMGQWGLDAAAYTTTIYPSSFETSAVGSPVTITISVSYGDLQLISGLVPTPANLTSSATMAKE